MVFVVSGGIYNIFNIQKDMITDIIIFIISSFINLITTILPAWQIWPADFLNGVSYIFGQLAGFNFIFPIDTLFDVIIFFISFEVAYMTAKLIIKVLNFFRGTGSGLDI
jgi:hypothetical protein